MNELDDKVTEILNNLISICKDGEKGFKKVAEESKDSEFQALCTQYSLQRAKFANELTDAVLRHGGNPDQSGSLAGDAHRGWIEVKAAVTGSDEDALIAECERGEDAAKEAYEKALKEYMPAEITQLIQAQYDAVKESHDRFRRMQKAAR